MIFLSHETQRLLEEKAEDEQQIQKDIHRTFPKHIFFREQGGMGCVPMVTMAMQQYDASDLLCSQTALFNTLKAYAVYDKKVGYCQGMGFIIALLLLYMGEEV